MNWIAVAWGAVAFARSGGALSEAEHVLNVLAPFDAGEVARLERCFAENGSAWDVRARVVRIVAPDVRDLAADTLLLGYEEGILAALAAEGGLAGGVNGCQPLASEGWSPAWRVAPDIPPPDVGSFRSFLDCGRRGRVVTRRPTATGSEALLLGAIAADSGWSVDIELREVLFGDVESGTWRSDTASREQIAQDLAAGMAMLLPIRTAEAIKRAAGGLEWAAWREGVPTLLLGAGMTAASSRSATAWFNERFARDVAPVVRAALELEAPPGAGDLPTDAPEWQRQVAPLRFAFDRREAARLRDRLVELATTPDEALPESAVDAAERWIDVVLLTCGVVAIWIAAIKTRRRRRDPRGDSVV